MAMGDLEEHRLVSREAFVRTYDLPETTDPSELVTVYHHLRDGLETATSALGLEDTSQNPADRWGNLAQQAIRDLEVAEGHQWVDLTTESEIFRGLNVLVATICSTKPLGADRYTPEFPVESARDIDRVAWAIHRTGVGYRFSRSGQAGTAKTLSPKEHPTILGRVLVALGAPVSGAQSKTHLPAYLEVVEHLHQRAFARTYLANRAHASEDSGAIVLEEDRDEPYLQNLRNFLRSITGEGVRCEGTRVIVSAGAADRLGLDKGHVSH